MERRTEKRTNPRPRLFRHSRGGAWNRMAAWLLGAGGIGGAVFGIGATDGTAVWPPPAPPGVLRVATFNASLQRRHAGQLLADLRPGTNTQARAVAEIIQRVRPDILLLNEFDYDPAGAAAAAFCQLYLEVGQHGAAPVHYPYRFLAESNTGQPSGVDLDRNGRVGGPGDAFGFGWFPGQYGMLLLSRYPIQRAAARTFRKFLWRDMPGALWPDDPATAAPGDWYSPQARAVFRLSSKSHWDVPVRWSGGVLHVLASHPTPPTFDGPEDRNGRRNHDEIRFWADYLAPARSGYIYDDDGRRGGLARNAWFVICGDQNADPYDGDGTGRAIWQLLEHPRVRGDVAPRSPGGGEQARLQGKANLRHRGDPALDTADFPDRDPGNLRTDYVLPCRALKVTGSGVFWPATTDPRFRLVGTHPFPSSDHRLVWVDLQAP